MVQRSKETARGSCEFDTRTEGAVFRSFSGSDALPSYLITRGSDSDGDAADVDGVPELIVPGITATSDIGLVNSHPAFTGPDRILDMVVAIAALVFVAPLMLFIAIAIKLSSRGPVLFKQDRLGRGGRTFACYKFRTMRTDSQAVLGELLAADPVARAEWDRDQKLRKDPRIIAVGGFLRRTSLDELPQLFNVLMGDMSIVGPRPIVAAEAVRYRRYISDYCAVRPGITGLWQVSGRNHTTYRRRVACDVAYVRAKSAGNDLRIMALTVPTVLLARGAY